MTEYHKYSKIYALGHREVRDIFDEDCIVEEKIDGSQFSFGVYDSTAGPKLRCFSRRREIELEAPDSLFAGAVGTVKGLHNRGLLERNWTYRGEVLKAPRHNTLEYGRAPEGNVIIFDIDTGDQFYMGPVDKEIEAERLGLECVPCYPIAPTCPDDVKGLLEKESCLGKAKIEGVVIKNYKKFGEDKKVLMGKYVSEAFKELHQGAWKKANPSIGDVIQELVDTLRTEARWRKAMQHLADDGALVYEPKDIGLLIREIQKDVKEEQSDYIREILFAHAWKKIQKQVVGGAAEWYKDELLKLQFEGEAV